MDIRPLTQTYAVTPQIAPEDMAEIRKAGFTRVVCNRPDLENPPALQGQVMAQAAQDAGLEFVYNPVVGGGMNAANPDDQREALRDGAKVLAYCASGTRSTVVWALSSAGTIPTDEILSATAQAGYPLEGIRQQINMLAGR
ncbi:TIGR01244 family sulfur transferase [Brevirhabdus sp.]|uniref:TIGR01244 family sulfur transferase n=1 Tax=Brevirhabdus sp. TaxID=2004514 RepID=UPI0040592F0D